ncbi:MAG: DUF2125 domain-containing protein [Paracoccaceae bacterium]
MKRLLLVILLAALGWAGLWIWGAQELRAAYEDWFAERRADGWVAEHDTLSVRGFPNRFDLRLTDLSLADPASGLAWEAPDFHLMRLSYRPRHLIAVWPEDFLLATPRGKLGVAGQDMRASLILRPDAPLALERANLAAETLTLTPGEGGAWAVARLSAAVRREAAAGASYRFAVTADGVAPPAPMARGLPETLEAVRADLTVEFDRPWDMAAVEGVRPQPRQVKITRAELRWGGLELEAAGRLEVDEEGWPEGRLDLRAQNWREILRLGREGGMLAPGLANTLLEGLSLLAGLSGNPETLDLPLSFRNRVASLGPIPIGPAPRLVIP